MLQAAVYDRGLLNAAAFGEDGLRSAEVDVSRRGVVDAFVIADVTIRLDEDVNTTLHWEMTALELRYTAGILPNTSVWPPGMGPLPPKKWS